LQRFSPAVFVFLLAAAPAAADAPVVLLAGDAPQMEALGSALQLAVAGDGWRVMATPAVEGATALQRAATAQAAAREAGARATLWVEEGPEEGVLVRLVDVDGESPRHAPLPTTLARAEPRAFAAVAASLLDELAQPPQRLRVRVHVSVEAEDGTYVTESGSARITAGERSAVVVLGDSGAGAAEGPGRSPGAPLDTEERSEGEPEAASPSDLETRTAGRESPPAPDPEPNETPGWRFGADVAPFVGMSSVRRGRGTRTVSAGLFGTLSGGLEGVAASSGVNIVTGDATGAMLGTGNWTHGGLRGVQVAGAANVTVGEVHGAQLSGGLNIATGALHGVQASGGVNIARGGAGLQLGSVNIQSEKFDGFQLGLVNVSRGTKLSLGLVNVVRGGRTHLEATYGADGFGFLMLKHGAARWHSIYSIGGRPGLGDEDPVLAGGLGFGGHFRLSERFALDLDLVVHYLHDFAGTEALPNEDGAELLGQLRLAAQLELHDRFALVFGASLNGLAAYADESTYVPWAKTFEDDEGTSVDPQRWRYHAWPSVFVGIRAF